jgi:hypothetical protein
LGTVRIFLPKSTRNGAVKPLSANSGAVPICVSGGGVSRVAVAIGAIEVRVGLKDAIKESGEHPIKEHSKTLTDK